VQEAMSEIRPTNAQFAWVIIAILAVSFAIPVAGLLWFGCIGKGCP
jgi:hypothetical protein